MAGSAATAGLALTGLGKVFGRSPRRLAAGDGRAAVADAGLELSDPDRLLVCPGASLQADPQPAPAVRSMK